MEVSREMEIAQVQPVRPHLVLLGAGASKAALPAGDAKGRQLPVMDDFVDVVGLGPVLERAGISYSACNFEELYSYLVTDPACRSVCDEVERIIHAYFASLELPDVPTIYDQLLLSLREKDVIATFNWDPFLI